MTFSILGRCELTGRLGLAVTSSSLAVASRCAFVRAGVGAASSQNVTDPRLGPKLLDAVQAGASAQRALDSVAAAAPHAEFRQLALVDASGASAAWSGEGSLGTHGSRTGEGWAVAGNLLASEDVLDAVASGFTECEDPELEVRLIAGLAAGLRAGGEAGPLASAGLLAAGEVEWPETNLRIDSSPEDGGGPIAELARLWERWAPERDDYVTRGLDPSAAPSYGVPGDPGDSDSG